MADCVVTSLLLLGIEDEPLLPPALNYYRYRRRVGAIPVRDFLSKQTSDSFAAVVHFLLYRLDAKKAASEFGAIFPPKTPKDRVDFRAVAEKWLAQLQREGSLDKGVSLSASTFVFTTPAKGTAIISALSEYVLSVVAQKEYGINNVVVSGVSGSERVLAAKLVSETKMFMQERRCFRRFCDEAKKSLTTLEQLQGAVSSVKEDLEKNLSTSLEDMQSLSDEQKDAVVNMDAEAKKLWSVVDDLLASCNTLLASLESNDDKSNQVSSNEVPSEALSDEDLLSICETAGIPRMEVSDGLGIFSMSKLDGLVEQGLSLSMPRNSKVDKLRMEETTEKWAAVNRDIAAEIEQKREEREQRENEMRELDGKIENAETKAVSRDPERRLDEERRKNEQWKSKFGVSLIPDDESSGDIQIMDLFNSIQMSTSRRYNASTRFDVPTAPNDHYIDNSAREPEAKIMRLNTQIKEDGNNDMNNSVSEGEEEMKTDDLLSPIKKL